MSLAVAGNSDSYVKNTVSSYLLIGLVSAVLVHDAALSVYHLGADGWTVTVANDAHEPECTVGDDAAVEVEWRGTKVSVVADATRLAWDATTDAVLVEELYVCVIFESVGMTVVWV